MTVGTGCRVYTMYILVLFIPILSVIISGLFGRKIGAKGAGILTSICISISAILSCCIFYFKFIGRLYKKYDDDLIQIY